MIPSIPDREIDVELVVDDSGAALAVTMKCGRAPTVLPNKPRVPSPYKASAIFLNEMPLA